MAQLLSKPPPHFTLFQYLENPPADAEDSILTLSIDTSTRRRRRHALLSVSGTLISQLFFFDRKSSSSANAADFFNFGASEPEPERTVELAQV